MNHEALSEIADQLNLMLQSPRTSASVCETPNCQAADCRVHACTMHDLAVALAGTLPTQVFERAVRVDQVEFALQPAPLGERCGVENANLVRLLVFAYLGGDEVLLVAYPCDEAGVVQTWAERYEQTGANWNCAFMKLRFGVVNELIHAVEVCPWLQ